MNAAKAALADASWKQLPATERGQLMARLADLMEENRELLASIDAWDNGMLEPRYSKLNQVLIFTRQALSCRRR